MASQATVIHLPGGSAGQQACASGVIFDAKVLKTESNGDKPDIKITK